MPTSSPAFVSSAPRLSLAPHPVKSVSSLLSRSPSDSLSRPTISLSRSSFIPASFASSTPVKSATPTRSWTTTTQPLRMVADNAAPVPEQKGVLGLSPQLTKRLHLGWLFFLWYFFNVLFNLCNKSMLNKWSYPWILSTIQLGTGSLYCLIQWILGIREKPKVSFKLFKAMILPTLAHLTGHVSTCIAFSYVAVSFAHIVKAAEPLFGALGSALVLGEIYNPSVYLSLVPIIVGVSLSAVTEISFAWPGFLFAMLSNLAFAARNVFSKLTMKDFKNEKTLTGPNTYGLISVMAFLLEVPLALYFEGVPAMPAKGMLKFLAGSAIFYHLYNESSFRCLSKVSPVTHAVGNVIKRVSVIIVSLIVFKNPVKLINAGGMALAISGTFLYSLLKTINGKKKAKAA